MLNENFKYKKLKSFEHRFKESTQIMQKYPNRIPIIIEKNELSKIQEIDKTKFLTPTDLTISQFICVIRKRIKLNHHESIFIFINNNIPCTSSFIGQVYDEFKDDDGFLYINYSSENVFG